MTRPYTNQTAFDKICERLFDGNGQCMGTEGCLYRRSDGNKCAIGYLIEDEDYDVSMENFSVEHIPLPYYLQTVNIDLLDALQTLHDRSRCWIGSVLNSYGIKALKVIAINWGLVLPSYIK